MQCLFTIVITVDIDQIVPTCRQIQSNRLNGHRDGLSNVLRCYIFRSLKSQIGEGVNLAVISSRFLDEVL